MATPSLFGIVGWKNSGKTTLMAKLIAKFAEDGLKVAAIKHAHHNFDVDHKGRDSFRYREAGANTVIVASAARYAIMKELDEGEPEPTLAALAERVVGADIILVEGFKREPHPKLEVRRKEAADHDALFGQYPAILAVACDHPCETAGLPRYDLNDVEGIATFISGVAGLTMKKF